METMRNVKRILQLCSIALNTEKGIRVMTHFF